MLWEKICVFFCFLFFEELGGGTIFSSLFVLFERRFNRKYIYCIYIYIYTHEWFVDYHKYLLNKIFEMSGKEVVANR